MSSLFFFLAALAAFFFSLSSALSWLAAMAACLVGEEVVQNTSLNKLEPKWLRSFTVLFLFRISPCYTSFASLWHWAQIGGVTIDVDRFAIDVEFSVLVLCLVEDLEDLFGEIAEVRILQGSVVLSLIPFLRVVVRDGDVEEYVITEEQNNGLQSCPRRRPTLQIVECASVVSNVCYTNTANEILRWHLC